LWQIQAVPLEVHLTGASFFRIENANSDAKELNQYRAIWFSRTVERKASNFAAKLGITLILITTRFSVAQTADEVIAKHFSAVGSPTVLSSIISTRTNSIVFEGTDVAGVRAIVYVKRPNRLRIEYSFPQALVIMAYDGKIAWSQPILPNGKKTTPSLMSADDTRKMLADFDQALDDGLFKFQSKGNSVRLVGLSKVMGREVYEIKLVLKDGSRESRFIDTMNWMEIKRTKTDSKDGSLYEIYYSDFKNWKGVVEPYDIKVYRNGKLAMSTKIEEVSFDIPVDDAVFGVPD
jgi:outer membrane lipoprotein-sorting protein